MIQKLIFSYDYLFITCGMQYLFVGDFEEMNNIRNCYALNVNSLPDILSAIADANHEQNLIGTQGKNMAAVYGRTLASLSIIQNMIDRGVDPSRIVLISPPNNPQFSCLENSTCDEKVIIY